METWILRPCGIDASEEGPALVFELYESECNGICIMGYEILEGATGVAYPHPDCELHSPRPEIEFEEPEYKGEA